MTPHKFKKYISQFGLGDMANVLFYALPIFYFSVITLGMYQMFGIHSPHIYISTLLLIGSLFWGFHTDDRAIVSFFLLLLVLINFLIDGAYSAVLFMALAVIFYGLRELGVMAIIVLILFNIYSLVNPDKLITNVPKTERMEDVSSFLTGYPEHNLTLTKFQLFRYIVNPTYAFVRMKNHHIDMIYNSRPFKYEWVGTHKPSEAELAHLDKENALAAEYYHVFMENLKRDNPEKYEKDMKRYDKEHNKINTGF